MKISRIGGFVEIVKKKKIRIPLLPQVSRVSVVDEGVDKSRGIRKKSFQVYLHEIGKKLVKRCMQYIFLPFTF